MFDFYKDVPTDVEENTHFRISIRERCEVDEAYRNRMLECCKNDVLFFFMAFCYLYEPRTRYDKYGNVMPKTIPFIPWENQFPAIKDIYTNLGVNDIAVYKSRGEGLSWIGVLLALHDWLFDDMAKVGLVSSSEKKADDPGNLDSLMAKIDMELTKLPVWMAGVKDIDWKRHVNSHSLVNLRNGSQLNAFAATATSGRAGRYKWFLADELAFWEPGDDRKFMESVRESTECRLAISTPNGNEGAFYDMVHVPSNRILIKVQWTQNTYKNRGLYKIVNDVPVAVDPEKNPLPQEYQQPVSQDVLDIFARLRSKGFRLENRLRSPWYDRQCDRGDATPQSIAQELDLDFGGSMHRVFTPEFTEKATDTCCKPILDGYIDYHPETLKIDFSKRHGGECKLWCQLDAMGRPPLSTYALGVDIGSGLGGSHTSNSVCEVIDRLTNEQVFEYASNTIEPSDFAELCVAIAKWFYDGYLAWEANFGGGFTSRVIRLGYQNVYMRTIHWKKAVRKKQKEVGWWTDDRTKELLFSDMHRKVKAGEAIIRSEDLLRECGEYVRTGPQSKIEHILALRTLDQSSRGKAHGDRVIAFGLAVQLLEDRPVIDPATTRQLQGPPPQDTLAWRVQQWDREDRPPDPWDDRTLLDVSRRGAIDGFLG